MKNLKSLEHQGSDEATNFSYLYNNAACGLLTFDLTGKVHHINQTLLEWTGLNNAPIDDLNFLDLLEKGSKLYSRLFIYPLLRMHNEVKEISLQMENKGNTFQCLFNARVIEVSKQDNEVMVHASVFKVVDRKKFEDELRMRKEKAELETLQKEESLKKVASEQSHLVRAPLANVLGLIALLEQAELKGNSSELIVMLKDSANQLDTVIKSIVTTANENQ